MKIISKLLSALIVLIMIAQLFSCGGDKTPEIEVPTDTEPVPEETAPLIDELLADGEAAYVIVSPDGDYLCGSIASAVSEALKGATGAVFLLSTDLAGWQGIPDRNEILIGNTNREETQTVTDKLDASRPFAVETVGKRIVIAGIDEASIGQAARQFLKDYTGIADGVAFVPAETAATAIPAAAAALSVATPGAPIGDMTGHPEVSAANADIEALLKPAADFDYTEEYKIRFAGEPSQRAWPAQDIATGLIINKYDGLYNVVADFNVRSFGAAGDGVHDDTEAFRKAAAAADAAGGGTIFVPRGYYCLTGTIELGPLVTLAGELKPGTAEGTVLCIFGGKGSTDRKLSAIRCGAHASVQNLAFWYPEQTFVNGRPIPYPPSVSQCFINGLTVRNVTFVNSYIGIDAAEKGAVLALEYIRDNCGTCLEYGFRNEYDLDVGKVENFELSPDFWLESGLPGTPSADLLRTYMIRNSTGIRMGGADWFYFSDIKISGYCKGFHFYVDTCRTDDTSVANGQILNPVLTDCYTPFYLESVSWFKVTGGELRATGNSGACAVFSGPENGTLRDNQPGSLHFAGTKIESTGKSAVIFQNSKPHPMFVGCTVKSASDDAVAKPPVLKYVAVDSEFKGVQPEVSYTGALTEAIPDVDGAQFGKVTKPASDKFVNITAEPYNAKSGTDVGDIIQRAIDDIAPTGGTVYIPAGEWYVNRHIDIKKGVELRGSSYVAHVDVYLGAGNGNKYENGTNPYRPCGTLINAGFGIGDPDGQEFIAMYEGSGLCGMSIEYPGQLGTAIKPASYTIRGYGSDIYVIGIGMSTSWNGIDFATNRCDRHYVEFIWSVGLNVGIKVGAGSEGGIIRDCHYTVNCWQSGRYVDPKYWDHVAAVAQDKGKTFVIGESKGEILYNNFGINQSVVYMITDGARDVKLIGCAADYSDADICVSGDCTVTSVNGQFVCCTDQSGYKYCAAFYANSDFSGSVRVINAEVWGKPSRVFALAGTGSAVGISIGFDSKVPVAYVSGGTAFFAGLLPKNNGMVSVEGGPGAGQITIAAQHPSSRVNVSDKLPKDKVTVIK